MMDPVESTSIRFAGAARDLARAARLRGLDVPTFTSPPRLTGVSRTIRRRRGSAVVAIAIRDRPWSAVLADMIEGIVVANGLDGVRADQIRSVLWLAVETPVVQAA